MIKRLFRQVKDLSNGCFKMLPLSEIVRKLQLNPFETQTLLRDDIGKRQLNELTKRNMESTEKIERQSELFKSEVRNATAAGQSNPLNQTLGGEDFSMCIIGTEEDVSLDDLPSENKMLNRQSRIERPTIIEQTNIYGQENLFQQVFPRILTEQCGYVLDNKSRNM